MMLIVAWLRREAWWLLSPGVAEWDYLLRCSGAARLTSAHDAECSDCTNTDHGVRWAGTFAAQYIAHALAAWLAAAGDAAAAGSHTPPAAVRLTPRRCTRREWSKYAPLGRVVCRVRWQPVALRRRAWEGERRGCKDVPCVPAAAACAAAACDARTAKLILRPHASVNNIDYRWNYYLIEAGNAAVRLTSMAACTFLPAARCERPHTLARPQMPPHAHTMRVTDRWLHCRCEYVGGWPLSVPTAGRSGAHGPPASRDCTRGG
ncbi:hypothetical protein EON67_04965 [archaeon]|nr:MAG: hypothetical protein EON67_04965 [archaeon]